MNCPCEAASPLNMPLDFCCRSIAKGVDLVAVRITYSEDDDVVFRDRAPCGSNEILVRYARDIEGALAIEGTEDVR
jgi:hypothetical protein